MPVFEVEISRRSSQVVRFNAPTMKAAEAWVEGAERRGLWYFDFDDFPTYELTGPFESNIHPTKAEFAVGHDGEYIE